MKLDLNDNKLRMTGLASLMIYTAVVLKNGGEQLGMKKGMLSGIVGPMLFTMGWMSLAHSVVGRPKLTMKSMLSWGGAAGVVVAVMSMKIMNLSEQQKKVAGMMFVGSWVATALSVGMGKSKRAQGLAMVALAYVLGSMLFVLPWQRTNGVVDGPGMTLFGLTWVALVLANSMQ